MDIKDGVVVFKSNPEMYELENSGAKPNTVRLIHNNLYDILEDSNNVERIEKIKIINSESDESFIRPLLSIVGIDKYFHVKDKHTLVVFSWIPFELIERCE